jgi:hypothetical protein
MRAIYAKQLEQDIEIRPYTSKSGKIIKGYDKREVFVITNPSKNLQDIKKLIFENEKLCPINKEKIEKQQYIHFVRYYYKESKETPIDFVEDAGGGFFFNLLSDHVKDFICSIEMIRKVQIDSIETIEWGVRYTEEN